MTVSMPCRAQASASSLSSSRLCQVYSAAAPDPGFTEKLERLVQEGTEILHIGICAGKTEEEGCPGMVKMVRAFRDKGVKVVWGTHGK